MDLPQTMKPDLVVHSANQLLTLASPDGPRRGQELQRLDIIEGGAVAIQGDRIVLVGDTKEVLLGLITIGYDTSHKIEGTARDVGQQIPYEAACT